MRIVSCRRRSRSCANARGLTLIELIIAFAIIGLLAGAAVPVVKVRIKRDKEIELRRDLWEMRDAIDRYKDAADRGAFQTKVDSLGYPPDLQTLVDGVDVQGKKLRFLRSIPVDPMTGNTDWGLIKDANDNVMGVYSKSTRVPIKVDGFQAGEESFRAATQYQGWRFVYPPQ